MSAPEGPAQDRLDAASSPEGGRWGAWLFLAAGVALLASVVLIPAYDDMDEVRWQRERARAFEAHRQLRLDRYGQYLAALDREEPALMAQLAAEHLNLIPVDKQALDAAAAQADAGTHARTVFDVLEPPPLASAAGAAPGLGDRPRTGSMLERWTLDERVRPWLIAFGGLCLLIGLLPPVQAQAKATPSVHPA